MSTYSQRASYDARVWDGHANTNYGSLEFLNMGEFGDGEKCEIFLYFDLSSIPSGSQVSAAKLYIYQYDDDSDWLSPTIQTACELCGSTWTESGITWSNKPSNAAGTPQALKSFSNLISTYVDYNVVDHIQGICDGTFTNYGFRLRYTGTSSETMKYFRSSEYGTSSKRPLLEVTYEVAQAKVWTGSAFVNKPLKYWTGSAWDYPVVKRYTGSTFEIV